jgi:cytochrome b
MSANVRVWDLGTRLFHWLLVANVLGLVVSGNLGGGAMIWHFRFGYCVLALLLFRLFWGFMGGYWSRFASFLYKPQDMLNYIHGNSPVQHSVGHNPLGAMSVFAMLLFLMLQVISGLMSDDEIAASGPLVRWISSDLVSSATWYHKEIGKSVLIALMVAHIGAIFFYLFDHKINLVKPMLHGDKTMDEAVLSSRDGLAERLKALVIFLLCAVAVAATVSWIN